MSNGIRDKFVRDMHVAGLAEGDAGAVSVVGGSVLQCDVAFGGGGGEKGCAEVPGPTA